jgi:hypothetical protein
MTILLSGLTGDRNGRFLASQTIRRRGRECRMRVDSSGSAMALRTAGSGAQLPFADGADIGRCWNTNRPFVATNPTRRVE